jgi:hypothetical protein
LTHFNLGDTKVGLKNLDLALIEVPYDGLIKDDSEWRYEKVRGIGVYIQNVTRGSSSAQCKKCHDFSLGMKYGIFVNYNIKFKPMQEMNNQLSSMGFSPTWMFYLYEELIACGFSEDQEDIFLTENEFNFHIWTTNKDLFIPIRNVISKAIRNIAKCCSFDDESTVIDQDFTYYFTIGKRNNSIPEYKAKMGTANLIEMYYDCAYLELPRKLSVGICDAMVQLQKKSIHHDVEEIDCVVDVDQSAFIFYSGEKQDYSEDEIFYIYPCETIKLCDDWCSEVLYQKNAEEAINWLSQGFLLAEQNGAFENFKSVNIIGIYDYGRETTNFAYYNK